MATTTTIDYTDFHDLWQRYDDMVIGLARERGAQSVAELGGGAKPLIGDPDKWGFVPQRVVIDISAEELAKADGDVETRVADLCQPISGPTGTYDVVFSKMLCEHLPNPEAFHANCYAMLKPGGIAVHFFPTLFTLPFVLNRLIPEEFARSLLRKIQPGRIDDPKHEKFPAYYRWCTGPMKRTLRRYQNLGFQVEAWHGAYGHYYYIVLPPLNAIEQAKSRFLVQHPVPAMTSFAAVVLRKPE